MVVTRANVAITLGARHDLWRVIERSSMLYSVSTSDLVKAKLAARKMAGRELRQ